MAKAKTRRRTVKETEEILSLAQRGLNFAQINLKWLVLGGAALALILAGWGINTYRHHSREAQAQIALDQLRPRLHEVDKAGEAMVTLDRLREDFAGTEAAQMGLLFKAHLLYQTKKYADAAKAYEDLLADLKGTDTPGWKVFATESLSYCYEALGDYSRAAQVLQPVIDQVSGAYQGALLERLAFLFDQAGNAKEAQRSWERLLKEPRDPSRIPYLKEKLAEAEAKVKQGGK